MRMVVSSVSLPPFTMAFQTAWRAAENRMTQKTNRDIGLAAKGSAGPYAEGATGASPNLTRGLVTLRQRNHADGLGEVDLELGQDLLAVELDGVDRHAEIACRVAGRLARRHC